MFCSLVVVPLPRFRQDIAVYWQTFEEAGHTRTGEEVALLFPLYVAETEEEAQTVPRQSIMHYFEVLGRRMVAGTPSDATPAPRTGGPSPRSEPVR